MEVTDIWQKYVKMLKEDNVYIFVVKAILEMASGRYHDDFLAGVLCSAKVFLFVFFVGLASFEWQTQSKRIWCWPIPFISENWTHQFATAVQMVSSFRTCKH